MMASLPLAMNRFVALVLLFALPLQVVAALVAHIPGVHATHAAADTAVHGQVARHDSSGSGHPPLPTPDTAACCIFAGFCYGHADIMTGFRLPLDAALVAEPPRGDASPYTSFALVVPDRPPAATL